TRRGWYSLLIPTDNGIEIHAEALDYDAASAAKKVRARGLPEGYAVALETGLWPSCDVLPAAELRLRGRAISAGAVRWDGASGYWPAMVPDAH
ncbi:hypothetical protein ACI4A9_28025, partial [Klebsiella pneumoniae]